MGRIQMAQYVRLCVCLQQTNIIKIITCVCCVDYIKVWWILHNTDMSMVFRCFAWYGEYWGGVFRCRMCCSIETWWAYFTNRVELNLYWTHDIDKSLNHTRLWDVITYPCPNFNGCLVNSSPPGQNGRQFANDIFRYIFVNEKCYILINISLKFVSKGTIVPALV